MLSQINKRLGTVLLGIVFLGESLVSVAADDRNIFVNLAKRVVPSVVNISTYTNQPAPQIYADDYFRWFFEEFFGGQGGGQGPFGPSPHRQRPRQFKQQPRQNIRRPLALGTGFLIDKSGLILTNNHVIGEADEIRISFTEDPNEEPTEGKVIGNDADLDIALIQVKNKFNVEPLPLGDSDALEVGEYVAAVGNPFGKGHSISHGIISAKHRDAPGLPLAKYIQTDAPINPGNSGGPLVNLNGEVIGINNAIDQRAQGIGFAIPISYVKKVLPQLKAQGRVERGYIGVLMAELSPEIADQIGAPKDLKAPFVTQVQEGEAADRAGMKPYDVITEFNGKKIADSSDLINAVTSVGVGDAAKIKVLRHGKSLELSLKVSKRPSSGDESERNRPRGRQNDSDLDTGMMIQDLRPEIAQQLGLPRGFKGIVVMEVLEGGPAYNAGINEGDIILEVNQRIVKSVKEFNQIVKKKSSYLLRVQQTGRNGEPVYRVVVLDLKG